MIKIGTIIWMVMVVFAAIGLYQVKYEVHTLNESNADLRKELNQEQKYLQVAKAEWAYLNRPERLEILAKKHLDVQYVSNVQLAAIDNLPMRGALMLATAMPTARAMPVVLFHAE